MLALSLFCYLRDTLSKLTQYWGSLDKMSEVNFSPAETLTLFISMANVLKF